MYFRLFLLRILTTKQHSIYMQLNSYKEFIQNLKVTILQSRYVAARLANKELLNLYFQTGKIIVEQINENEWGTKIIDKISNDLQFELPGLRGF